MRSKDHIKALIWNKGGTLLEPRVTSDVLDTWVIWNTTSEGLRYQRLYFAPTEACPTRHFFELGLQGPTPKVFAIEANPVTAAYVHKNVNEAIDEGRKFRVGLKRGPDGRLTRLALLHDKSNVSRHIELLEYDPHLPSITLRDVNWVPARLPPGRYYLLFELEGSPDVRGVFADKSAAEETLKSIKEGISAGKKFGVAASTKRDSMGMLTYITIFPQGQYRAQKARQDRRRASCPGAIQSK